MTTITIYFNPRPGAARQSKAHI